MPRDSLPVHRPVQFGLSQDPEGSDVEASSRSDDMLQRQDFPLDRWRKIHEHEIAFVVQTVLAALIHDPDQIILRRPWIWKNAIDLSRDEGRLIAGIVNAKGEGVCSVLS